LINNPDLYLSYEQNNAHSFVLFMQCKLLPITASDEKMIPIHSESISCSACDCHLKTRNTLCFQLVCRDCQYLRSGRKRYNIDARVFGFAVEVAFAGSAPDSARRCWVRSSDRLIGSLLLWQDACSDKRIGRIRCDKTPAWLDTLLSRKVRTRLQIFRREASESPLGCAIFCVFVSAIQVKRLLRFRWNLQRTNLCSQLRPPAFFQQNRSKSFHL
jgi:hypothetical protein